MASEKIYTKIYKKDLANGVRINFLETNLQKENNITVFFSDVTGKKTKVTMPLKLFHISFLANEAIIEHNIIVSIGQVDKFTAQMFRQLEEMAIIDAREKKLKETKASKAAREAKKPSAVVLSRPKLEEPTRTSLEADYDLLFGKKPPAEMSMEELRKALGLKPIAIAPVPPAGDGGAGSASSNSAASSVLSPAAAAPSVLASSASAAAAEAEDGPDKYRDIVIDVPSISGAVAKVSASQQALYNDITRMVENISNLVTDLNENDIDDAESWTAVTESILSFDYENKNSSLKEDENLSLKIIGMVKTFNKITNAETSLDISENRAKRLPVFYFKNNGCLHITVSPNSIHFTCEKIKMGDAQRHIPFRLFYSEVGTRKIIVPKFLNGGKYELLTPRIVADIYTSRHSPPGGGAGASAHDGCNFLEDALILLECVIFVFGMCNSENLILRRKRGGEYYEKYLKYKQKYLSLRKMLLRNP